MVPARTFSQSETTKFPLKIVIYSLLCINFFDKRNILKPWWVRPRIFSVVWDKKFCNKLSDTPIVHIKCRYLKSEKSRRIPPRSFWYCDTNKFPTDNRFSNPLLRRIFRCSKLWNTKAWDIKNLTKKMWYTPLMQKLFDAQKFLKHWRVHLRRFSPLRDQNCLTKIVISHLSCINFLDARNFMKHYRFRLESSSQLFLVRNKQFSTENRVISLLCTKLSITQKQWNTEQFPNKNFWYCDTNKRRQKILIPPTHE